MNVEPKIHTGVPEFGYQVDTTLDAFNKYNRHTHSVVTPTSFFSEDINIGDEVSLFNSSGKDVFYRPTPSTKVTISNINPNSITLSAAASDTVTQGTLVLTRGPVVDNINIDSGSSIVTRLPIAGLATPSVIDSSISKTISVYATVPENTLTGGGPSTQQSGSFVLDTNDSTINVSGTGINGTVILPALNLYRGKTYNFSFAQSSINNSRSIFINRTPTYVINQVPPVNRHSLGIENITTNQIVVGFNFTVPYSAPNILYYICPQLNNKVGIINVLNSDLDELPWSVGSVQTNINSILPSGLPDFTLPLILKATNNFRLQSINLMPIWSNPFSAGRFLVRLSNSLNTEFNYLTGKIVINSIGTISIQAPARYLEKDSTTQILLYEIEGLKALAVELNYINLV